MQLFWNDCIGSVKFSPFWINSIFSTKYLLAKTLALFNFVPRLVVSEFLFHLNYEAKIYYTQYVSLSGTDGTRLTWFWWNLQTNNATTYKLHERKYFYVILSALCWNLIYLVTLNEIQQRNIEVSFILFCSRKKKIFECILKNIFKIRFLNNFYLNLCDYFYLRTYFSFDIGKVGQISNFFQLVM